MTNVQQYCDTEKGSCHFNLLEMIYKAVGIFKTSSLL